MKNALVKTSNAFLFANNIFYFLSQIAGLTPKVLPV